ncbi:immobilization antigen (macronuclear) [Tetrahymena thermophila SB210]|uniref:Immobilization antigen n=1 Tax=Tetrahymena thermophila (strain SB210) TaxID=312017 RepID=Q232E6_TETTS|nr:immobilization antigen [Tetrahymena thermophila SB210]EAR91466.1 immobilization antigen [Tetrahymena thermophila SB210]|eukprot:XP_001011711.1 immobilization antigen [Tetrahymena thermophila SB210]
MKATSLILILLAVIVKVSATCTDANATAGAFIDTGFICYCNAGYYGTSTDSVSGGSCQKCPTGTNSVLATTTGTLVTSCICNDANSALNNGNTACQCKANFFGTPNPTAGGATGCTACPTGTASTAGSTAITSCSCNDTNAALKADNIYCVCKANFYGTPNPTAGGATGCTACPTGTASTAGSTAVTSCSCNDTNATLKADNSACFCKANFYGTPTTFGASGCTACPAGTISADGQTDKSQCTCPDVNASLNSATPPSCQCNANFYGTPTTSGASGCITCPTGTTSAAGSTTKYSCACPDTNASLNFDIPPVCQCNPNFYGIPTTSGASGCTICPLGQTAPAGSVTNVCGAAFTSSTYILSIVSLLFSIVMLI